MTFTGAGVVIYVLLLPFELGDFERMSITFFMICFYNMFLEVRSLLLQIINNQNRE
jgi:hypothetical protein